MWGLELLFPLLLIINGNQLSLICSPASFTNHTHGIFYSSNSDRRKDGNDEVDWSLPTFSLRVSEICVRNNVTPLGLMGKSYSTSPFFLRCQLPVERLGTSGHLGHDQLLRGHPLLLHVSVWHQAAPRGSRYLVLRPALPATLSPCGLQIPYRCCA